jgi:hypothetical protein
VIPYPLSFPVVIPDARRARIFDAGASLAIRDLVVIILKEIPDTKVR